VGLLLLLRLLGQWGLDNFPLRFFCLRAPQPTLRHVENDGADPFKGDFARKVYALLRSASVFFRPGTRHGHSLMVAYRTNPMKPAPFRIRPSCTIGKERRVIRWEYEYVLEAVQRRLDEHPEKMRQRRATVEHPFGTIKARMGATHFLMKTLPRVAAEMALHVLAYNLTRVINIMGVQPLLTAIRA
jgi:Transposase DDE domain